MSDIKFQVTLINVSNSVEGNTALEKNCTHVTGSYWIMEGDLDFLREEGVEFKAIAEGAVGSLGHLSTEELVRVCKRSFAVDLGEPIKHPLEHRLYPEADEQQQRYFYIGAYEACSVLLTSPRMNKAQVEIIEEMGEFVKERLEALGVTFND